MVEPLIPLFKEQLENESATLAQLHGLELRGDYLIWWYFIRFLGMDSEEVEAIVTEGGGDLGIDAIHIDTDNFVHFYQFKNPKKVESALSAGDIDKMIAGLVLILNKNHEDLANGELKDRIEDIYQIVPAGYRIHIVTSGIEGGGVGEIGTKLDSFLDNLGGGDGFFTWTIEDISYLQDAFYKQNLPTVEEAIVLNTTKAPYQVRSAENDCYLFHAEGTTVASLYETYGEQLLQQNIRVYRGGKSTNAAIRATCTGDDSGNFLHFNNGITFLCESANYDDFTNNISLHHAQIVNGGQTARVLHLAFVDDILKEDVKVPLRVIVSRGDKDFANNVAVNLNNQNQVNSSFLKSNHPRVVQLASSCAAKGWYLERRANELRNLSKEELSQIEHQLGCPLKDRVIKLKEGAQAYTATLMRQPEMAKKNSKMIFLSLADGGSFEQIFSEDLSAENFINSQKLKWYVDGFVKEFGSIKRRKDKDPDWEKIYRNFFGNEIYDEQMQILDQVVPQSSVFLTAVFYEYYVRLLNMDLIDLIAALEEDSQIMIRGLLSKLITFGKEEETFRHTAWPTLLKNNSFFVAFSAFLKGETVEAN